MMPPQCGMWYYQTLNGKDESRYAVTSRGYIKSLWLLISGTRPELCPPPIPKVQERDPEIGCVVEGETYGFSTREATARRAFHSHTVQNK